MRPRKNPAVRFHAAASFLDTCMANQGGKIRFPTEAAATTALHQFNRYRKACREADDEGITMLDHYVFRKNGLYVEVVYRNDIDLSAAETLDGRPMQIEMRTPDGKKATELPIDWDLQHEADRLARQQGLGQPNHFVRPDANEIRERDRELARKPLKLDE